MKIYYKINKINQQIIYNIRTYQNISKISKVHKEI